MLLTTKWKKEDIVSQNKTFIPFQRLWLELYFLVTIDGIGLTGKY
jgi:hypothetical protein